MLASSTIAIIILAVAIVLFVTDRVPLPITAMMTMLAMAFCGVVSFNGAFSGFSNKVTLMIIGMSIVSNAFVAVGLSSKLSSLLHYIKESSERKFVTFVFLFALVLGAFFNAMIVLVMLVPVIDSLVANSKGRFSRKMVYLPFAIASIYGGQATSISASCIVTVSGMLADTSYGRAMTFFEPLKVSLPGILLCVLFFSTVGYNLQKKLYDFEETTLKIQNKNDDVQNKVPLWKQIFVVVVIWGCIAGFVNGLNFGAVALTGATMVMLTNCISCKEAFSGISWGSVFTVAASIGFAQGINESGAGKVITNAILSGVGPFVDNSAFAMCVLVMALSCLLSNFMSNTAAVTIVFPIAFAMSQAMGADAMAFAIACGLGSDMSIATPICQAPVTYTVDIGYRTKDYVCMGGLLNVAVFIVDAIALYFSYFN